VRGRMGTVRMGLGLGAAVLLLVRVYQEPERHWPLLFVAAALLLAILLRRTRFTG